MVVTFTQRWSYDRYVFKLLLMLSFMFTVYYTIGISLPKWFFLREKVSNFSSCITSHRYNDYHIFQDGRHGNEVGDSRHGDEVVLTVKSSLWYMRIKVEGMDKEASRFLPFIGIPSSSPYRTEDSLADHDNTVIVNEAPNGLVSLMSMTLLTLGVVFAWIASYKPSRRVFYGLSEICLILGITMWITIAMPTAKRYVIEVALDHCCNGGEVMTSSFVELFTGSCGLLALAFGMLLIHLSTLPSSSTLDQSDQQYTLENEKYLQSDNDLRIGHKYTPLACPD